MTAPHRDQEQTRSQIKIVWINKEKGTARERQPSAKECAAIAGAAGDTLFKLVYLWNKRQGELIAPTHNINTKDSQRTVRRHRKTLSSLGFIAIERYGRGNVAHIRLHEAAIVNAIERFNEKQSGQNDLSQSGQNGRTDRTKWTLSGSNNDLIKGNAHNPLSQSPNRSSSNEAIEATEETIVKEPLDQSLNPEIKFNNISGGAQNQKNDEQAIGNNNGYLSNGDSVVTYPTPSQALGKSETVATPRIERSTYRGIPVEFIGFTHHGETNNEGKQEQGAIVKLHGEAERQAFSKQMAARITKAIRPSPDPLFQEYAAIQIRRRELHQPNEIIKAVETIERIFYRIEENNDADARAQTYRLRMLPLPELLDELLPETPPF